MPLTFPVKFILGLCVGVLLTLAGVIYASAESVSLSPLQRCQLDLYAHKKSVLEWQMRALLAEAELAKTEGPKAMGRLQQEYEAWEKQARSDLQVPEGAVFDQATKSFVVK